MHFHSLSLFFFCFHEPCSMNIDPFDYGRSPLNCSHLKKKYLFSFCCSDWEIFIILSSRSLMLASASSSSQLFIPSRVCVSSFILVFVFYSFDCFFFLSFLGLCKNYHCIHLLFAFIQLAFLLLMLWTFIWWVILFH